MRIIPIFLLAFYCGNLIAQISSDYRLKKITETDHPIENIKYSAEDSAIFFLFRDEKTSKIMHLNIKNSITSVFFESTDRVVDFAVVPQSNKILIFPAYGSCFYFDGTVTSEFNKVFKRGIIAEEAVFNKSGKLIAIIGIDNEKLQKHLMTYDLKYDNLNKNFVQNGNVCEPSWSGRSDLISFTYKNTNSFISDIHIVGWDAKPVSIIHTDTLRLSNSVWGSSSTRFLCVGDGASGYYLLLFKTDGSLIEKLAYSSEPIRHVIWSNNSQAIYFTIETKTDFYAIWFLDYASLLN